MTPEGFKRRLSAILSADVKEYSRLTRDDEDATIRTLTAYRSAIAKLVQQYRGRVVDSPGDNVLAEFGSAVDAVNCAVEIQRELAERNAEVPYHRRMEFRIGINLGDIVQEEGRIYGDGVNIAARVESLAEGGGICISGKVHEEIEGKLGLEYEDLGEHEVKNIDKPIRVYRVLSFPGAAAHRVAKAKSAREKKWRGVSLVIAALVIVVAGAMAIWNFFLRPTPPSVEPALVERMAFPLPDKPSIAVLPFVNMSGDPEKEYIADGITENIISALSKISELFVIARTSTMTYKGKPVKVKQVSEELGVRYVLEGSVLKEGNRVRITAQLVDAIKGHHLWAERYDRDIAGFFDLLDEITKKIGAALQVQLTWGDFARRIALTDNFEAWSYFNKAYSHFLRFKKEDNVKARELSERAVELDPEYLIAYRLVGLTHVLDARFAWSKSPEVSIERAIKLAEKANTVDSDAAGTLWSWIYVTKRQYEKAIAEGEETIAKDPNYAIGYLVLAESIFYSGRFEEAIPLLKKGMRLHGPYYPPTYLSYLGGSNFQLGRYEEALAAYKRSLERSHIGGRLELLVHSRLAAVYIRLGRVEDARKHADEVLRLTPEFSLEWVRKAARYKDPAHLENLLDALRKAGLPENPPLPLPDKPSIAVLPFTNLSDDPQQEYFSDGMTDDLITDLSKISRIFVIARNSTFSYKGKPVKIRQVAEELGVRYVLEGSVRRAGNQVRINAQLIDTTTGHHLWAERYDGSMNDVFAMQDKINQLVFLGHGIYSGPGASRAGPASSRPLRTPGPLRAFQKGSTPCSWQQDNRDHWDLATLEI